MMDFTGLAIMMISGAGLIGWGLWIDERAKRRRKKKYARTMSEKNSLYVGRISK